MNLSLIDPDHESDLVEAIGGITGKKYFITPVKLAKIMSSIVSTTFKYPAYEKRVLHTQFGMYFDKIGLSLEDIISASANCILLKPDDHISKYVIVSMIYPGITMMLQNIAALSRLAGSISIFITDDNI